MTKSGELAMRGAIVGFALLLLTPGLRGMLGCLPPESAEPPLRARARAAVLAMAEGVKAADAACADGAQRTHTLSTAEACARAYGQARAALLASEALLDAGEASGAACAALPAARSLSELGSFVAAMGGALPPSVEDGVAMAAMLARLFPCPDSAATP